MSRENVIDDMNSVPETCKKHNTTMRWYGDWYCSECQQEEHSHELGGIEFALCWTCVNFEGDPYYGICEEYPNMPITMFRRRNKCKYYKEYHNQDGSW